MRLIRLLLMRYRLRAACWPIVLSRKLTAIGAGLI
jgi:hypothetical protein